MGSIRLDRLTDYNRHSANIKASCTCGHIGIVDGQKLRRWFYCHGWNDAIENVARRLYCSVCLGRPIKIRATTERPVGPEWGPRYEHDWKDLVRRLRNR